MTESEDCEISCFPAVGEAESGQKLLRLLQRRLNLPESLLHRWLRTGQIRLNGKRSKPFELVKTGDVIRLPPFVRRLTVSSEPPLPPVDDPRLPPIVGISDDIWGFAKPSGLAVQGGSNLTASLASLLATAYQGHAFIPAPAHRLDKDTSGIVLAGASFAALKQLHGWFAAGLVRKEYLAWTHGHFSLDGDYAATHYLEGRDRVLAHAEPAPGRCQARCVIRPLARRDRSSLLHIRLLTGCKRQIRAQLAALNAPVQGDSRYGAKADSVLRLHACRIILPNGHCFEQLPAWVSPWDVQALPAPFLLPGEIMPEKH